MFQPLLSCSTFFSGLAMRFEMYILIRILSYLCIGSLGSFSPSLRSSIDFDNNSWVGTLIGWFLDSFSGELLIFAASTL